ncbi:hypothetical protein BKI52_43970 [marine bacterium AO1-C]|nr:hypothetical protein BKI52_43970 [marine bacterium AO1-C]
MKIKLLVLSGLLLVALGSCRQGVKLPSEVKLSISKPGHFSRVDQGNYLDGWNLGNVTDVFKQKLTKYLKRNRVKVEDRGFINTPYRLVINNIIVDQTSSQVHKGGSGGCPLQTVTLDKVEITVNISLEKDGITLDRWVFSESCKERVGRNNFGNDSDDCDNYTACRILFFSLKKIIKRCAKQARMVVSNKIYETAF